MRGSFLLGTATVAVVVLSGCSSSSHHQASTSSPSSAAGTTAPASTTAPSSSAATTTSSAPASTTKVSAAGKKFLIAVAPVNHDLASFLTLPSASAVSTVTAAAAKAASGETALVRTLKKDTWPASSRSAFAALEAAALKESPVYQACAHDHSVTAVKATLLKGKPLIAARVAAALKVRTALGLPTT